MSSKVDEHWTDSDGVGEWQQMLQSVKTELPAISVLFIDVSLTSKEAQEATDASLAMHKLHAWKALFQATQDLKLSNCWMQKRVQLILLVRILKLLRTISSKLSMSQGTLQSGKGKTKQNSEHQEVLAKADCRKPVKSVQPAMAECRKEEKATSSRS